MRDERGIASSTTAWVVSDIGEDHGSTVHLEGAVDGVIQFDERWRDFVTKFPKLIAQLFSKLVARLPVVISDDYSTGANVRDIRPWESVAKGN